MANTVKDIESHLESEIQTACNKNLSSKGWSSVLPNTYESSLIKYLDFMDILSITDKHWQCVELPNFECPSELKTGYGNLKKALTSGKDIKKYMSKGIFRGNNDAMFNDWGILHFHLGSQLDNTGKYIERTNELVFIKFHEKTAYIIAIGKHGDWTKQKLIENLDSYTPELISHGLTDAIDMAYSPSDEELVTLRAKNANSAIKLGNGKTYIAINSGYSSSGNKTTSTISLVSINHCIYTIARLIVNNPNLKINNFKFHDYSSNSTVWGDIVNGVAFINTKNGKYLYCVGKEAKYSDILL